MRCLVRSAQALADSARGRNADPVEALRQALAAAGAASQFVADAAADRFQRADPAQLDRLVARALVRRPAWLVLDEPTEGLDIGTEEALLGTLAALHRDEGVTLLFVTHKLSIAARYATHVALFHEGRVTTGRRDPVLASEPARRIFGVELEGRA